MLLFKLLFVVHRIVPLPLRFRKTLLCSIIVATIVAFGFLDIIGDELIPTLFRTIECQCRADIQPLNRRNVDIV